MRRQEGFTLLELMVTVLILGVLSATAIPLYHTWTQRAYGTEASLMMKQILDGEIVYFLEHDEFFPAGSGSTVTVRDDGSAIPANAFAQIMDALKVNVPTGHHLDYTIQVHTTSASEKLCLVMIDSSPPPGFPLFKNDQPYLYAVLNEDGTVNYISLAEFVALLGS